MANPQQEMQKSFARVLGYDGPMQGFGNFIQSDPAISEKYKGMLAIAEKQRDMAKQNMMKMSQSPKPQMAQGGVVRKFQEGGFNPFQVGPQVVVYGSDGKQYGNPMIAERAGVTDYSMTQPSKMEQFPIAEAQPGGNMIPAGQGDQTSALQNSSGGINQPATLQGVKQVFTQPEGKTMADITALDKQISGQGFYARPAQLQSGALRSGQQRITPNDLSVLPPRGRGFTGNLKDFGGTVRPVDSFGQPILASDERLVDGKIVRQSRRLPDDMISDLFPIQPTVQGGVKTLDTAQPPQQAFQDVERPVYDTNQFLDDGTTPNPNYGQPVIDADGNPVTTTEAPNIGEMGAQMITQPGLPTGAAVEAVGVDPGTGQFLQTSVGGVTPDGVAVPTTLADTATVQQQQATQAAQLDPSLTQGQVG
jgi:hypothetical protein